jgi:hypothetical protein
MGLVDRLLVKTLEKQQEKLEEQTAQLELCPLATQMIEELKLLASDMGAFEMIGQFMPLFAGAFAGMTDGQIREGVESIIARLRRIVAVEVPAE